MHAGRIAQYEFVRPLGSGAHGTVYQALDTVLERTVVVKVLDRGTDSEGALRARVLEEARLAGAIDHPNVCAIYEVGEADGRPYIVMQYVPGRTLKEILADGPLALPFALSVGIQIADGLAAAHHLGILHRDLKPANVMVTEEGRVKLLDFALARRATAGDGEAEEAAGTMAYMAPEQFVLHRSSEQSDVFALGVLLYEMLTGRHPFLPPGADPTRVAAAIRTREPGPPGALNPRVPAALDEVVMRALAKQPAGRWRFAYEVRDALRAVMRESLAETGLVPGEASAVPPAPAPAAPERPGFLAGLMERFLPGTAAAPTPNALAILPFRDLDAPEEWGAYGFGLSNAVAARLSRVPSLVVRPLGAFLAVSDHLLDPLEAGRRLRAERVLSGGYARTPDAVSLHWELLDVASEAVRAGGTLALPGGELAVQQTRAAEEIHAALVTAGELDDGPPAAARLSLDDLPGEVREEFLEARGLLAGFAVRGRGRDVLERAREHFERVVERAPDFAPGHAGLGTAYLRSARNGFGGVAHLMAAQRHLSRALELDPELREARLYRASVLLWDGAKESARLDLQHLIRAAPDDPEVQLATGVVLQLDGLLDEALRVQSAALALNPTLAARVYHYRSRILLMQGRMEAARQEIQRGLDLEPDHTLLRNTLAYWHFYRGELDEAIALLRGVLADDPQLRIARPTLAICYLRAGRPDEAAALMTRRTFEAAAADAETAYRVATYEAVAGDVPEALSWLRLAIYRGNENHPWFAANPAWDHLRDEPEYRQILADLARVHRLNRTRWESVFPAVETG